MTKSIFFARQNYLNLLQKRVSGLKDNYRQNIAIIGDELVGKTSLIFKFLDTFSDNRILTLYFEARSESINSFARRFIGVLLYNFLINSALPLKEDIDFLIAKSQRYIPKTCEMIKLILDGLSKRKKNNIFSDLMSLCEILYKETGKSTVVILDEFQNLEDIGFKNLYRDWSKLLITNKNTMFIIISSLKFKTKAILSKNLSLLFGNFEVITVEPFDIRTSEEYLKCKFQNVNLNPALRDFVVHFTGGYPMYLEIISSAFTEQSGKNLADLLEGLLFDPAGILNQRFSNYIKRFLDRTNTNDYISILYLISSGRNKIKDIGHILHKQKKELDYRLNYLLELDTITRNGDFLKINDRIFSFWMKFVYQEKLQAFTFNAKNQKEKFRDKIEGMIQEFTLAAGKPLMERMSDLLRLFENELIQVERKKIRLNHFREIKPLEFRSQILKNGIIGRCNESLWIIAVKNEHLNEEDIVEFSKECRKYRHKLQRKIIITLKDIDMNTRLRALEEKIWAWDINNLNQILDLYSRPRVIA
ncbi:MAG: ATP-binding protein [Candidatus Omnitrophica bacterium]|nr:ATP-binding protein [Candidatus Omnitrophota bacterium]